MSAPLARPRLCLNLTEPADYGTELPWNNLWRCAGPFVGYAAGAKVPPLSLDADGFPTALPDGVTAQAPIPVGDATHVIPGTYVVLFDGSGLVSVGGCGVATGIYPGRLEVNVSPKPAPMPVPLFVRIGRTDPTNHVRNIRVLLPGTEATYLKQPFRQGFLDDTAGVAGFRFIDLCYSIGSKEVNWSDRAQPTTGSYFKHGAPFEDCLALCAAQGADAYLNVPVGANDDYVSELATLATAALPPWSRVILEYGVECWNGQYPTYQYVENTGLAAGLGFVVQGKPAPDETPNGNLAAWRYYADRTAAVMKLAAPILGAQLVRVLSTQLASPSAWLAGQMLQRPGVVENVDALGVGCYVPLHVGPATMPLNAAQVKAMTPDAIARWVTANVLPGVLARVKTHKALCDRYGLTLIAYEGGQGMEGVAGGAADTSLTASFEAANRSAAMGELYRGLLPGWADAGGSEFFHFSSRGAYGNFGCWPLAEGPGDVPPKLQACLDVARGWGQLVGYQSPTSA